MPRPKDHSLVRKSINLRYGDFEKLEEMFPQYGPTVAIRKILSGVVDANYAKMVSSRREAGPAVTVTFDGDLT